MVFININYLIQIYFYLYHFFCILNCNWLYLVLKIFSTCPLVYSHYYPWSMYRNYYIHFIDGIWMLKERRKKEAPKAVNLDSRVSSFSLCLVWRSKIGKQDGKDKKESMRCFLHLKQGLKTKLSFFNVREDFLHHLEDSSFCAFPSGSKLSQL